MNVEFVQADLTKPPHIDRAFKNTMKIDFVVNLAAETRYGQPNEVYDERCTVLSRLCAAKAAEVGVAKFIEVSTAQVYKSQNRKPSDESYKLDPWTKVASALLAAEAEVTKVPGLYSLILRPAFIYGPGTILFTAHFTLRITYLAMFIFYLFIYSFIFFLFIYVYKYFPLLY